MCGIWGISDMGADITHQVLAKIIKKLMVLSEVRGKDASGIAVMQDDSLCVLRKAKSSRELLRDIDFIKYLERNVIKSSGKNIWVAGHSRLVTNGTQYNPYNNQPVAKDNMVLVHNGIIVNDHELWMDMPGVAKKSELDSEIILEIFRRKYQETRDISLASAITIRKLRGMASAILLMQEGHHMIALSNNGSLYECRSRDGKLIIFASERLMLEKLISGIPKLKTYVENDTIKQLVPGDNIIISDGYRGDYKETDILQDGAKLDMTVYRKFTNYSRFEIDFEKIRKIRRCAKCVLPETMPFIEFDDKGICNYCREYHKAEYKGIDLLKKWEKEHKDFGKKMMVSFSGGRDSSYGLHYFVRKMGFKPLAYCYDWGMVTDIARRNQSRMCEKLGIEFILVSADIRKKRSNIKKNVEAWLKSPTLGMIPIFMAGDKHYFYYANKVKKDYGVDTILLASNPFEKTYFKSGFCGIKPDILKRKYKNMDLESLPMGDVIKMSGYYIRQYAKEVSYLNTSLMDTFTAAASYYVIPHNYFRLFDYIPWDEKTVNKVLIEGYDWECAVDTKSTWRIGDGTAPFYNYIYCMVAGLTENDTLRSNQVREGMLGREEALALVYRDNQPRFESMKWYFNAISVDMEDALTIISRIPKLYERNA